MCSLKSNLRVSAHWFIRGNAARKTWQRRLNSSASCIFQPRRCHPIDWNIARMSSWNKSNYFFLPSRIMEMITRKKLFLPSATTPELAASHPRATCRRGTEGICRCRVRARGFVPGSSLPGELRVAARHLRTALDWHSSSIFFTQSILFRDFFFRV